jgi:aminodeoxyfutalosine deaminase
LSFIKRRATQLFTGTEILNEDWVLITTPKDEVLEIILATEADKTDVLVFDGIISPGFVNCHCHLELSHLKNKIKPNKGLVNFLMDVVKYREAPIDQIEQEIANAESQMIANGIVAVGDICNTTHSLQQKLKGNLYYHNFIETTGFNNNNANVRFDAAKQVYNEFAKFFPNSSSIVPHAPYSVSSNLFDQIYNFLPNKIVSIHNQESNDENIFYKNATGNLLKLYQKFNIDISEFKPTQKSSLQSIGNYLTSAETAILVHNCDTLQIDIDFVKKLHLTNKTQFFWCLCVLANEYITNSFPSDSLIKNNLENIVIGTDSLASNNQLNIIKELSFIKKKYPWLTTLHLLKFATINGAKALQIDAQFGTLFKGYKNGIISIKKFC